MPLAAGTKVLGVELERRRFHSLNSAMVETGRGLKGLRRQFQCAGVLSHSLAEGPARSIVIPVSKTAQAVVDLAQSLPRAKAAAYLGAGVVTTKRLANAGLLVPLVPKPDVARSHVRFSTRVLDAFLEKLMRGVTGVAPRGADMQDVATAAHRTSRQLAAITTLVMDRKLRHVARRPGLQGFCSILVDLDEVRALPESVDEAGPTIDEAAAELRINRACALELIRTGRLRARAVPSQTSKRMIAVVERASLDDFGSKFVSLAELAGHLGICWRKVQMRLESRGVAPALPRSRTRSILYRRREATEKARLLL